MEKFLKILGVLIIIAGVLLGLYVGIYIMLYGGIMQIINSVEPMQTKSLVIGILKVCFCETAGIITYIGFMIGGTLIAMF